MTDTGIASGLLHDTVDRIFTERSGPEARRAAEAEGWATDCWDALTEAGLAWVGVPEEAGGSGGDIGDAFTLIRLVGRHAVALPLAECSLLGGWLVASGGLRLPEDGGVVTVAAWRDSDQAILDGHGRVTATLARVPWGARASAVAAVAQSADGPRVVLLDPALASVTPGRNVAGEPRDGLTWDATPIAPERVGAAAGADPIAELHLRGALSRALLMAGAMESVAALTIDYAAQRHQFGKAIASFQAVAQRLVRLSSEAYAGALAAEVAAGCFAAARPGVDAAFEVGAAKVATARAASEVAAHAHQVHGAIGMTQEYVLHHFTRRLWAWRQEWGSGRHWSRVVGEQVVAAGAEALWPRVATGLVKTSA